MFYRSVFKLAKGYIVNISLRLLSLKDAILPPFTSKVMKSIIARAECMKEVWKYYNSSSSFKPVTVRTLRTLDKRPIFKTNTATKVISIRRNSILKGEISIFVDEKGIPWDKTFLLCDEDIDIDIAKFRIIVEEVTIEDVRELSLGLTKDKPFKISFVTPLLITTKVMTPPTLNATKIYKLVEKSEKAHRLLPTPGYIASQAMREWIGIALGKRPDPLWPPYGIGRLSDIMVAELDFRLRPVTVIYDENRRPRGVLGYVIYKPLNKHIAETLDRLLAFAERMGLGKSRSIGFGEIKVSFPSASS